MITAITTPFTSQLGKLAFYDKGSAELGKYPNYSTILKLALEVVEMLDDTDDFPVDPKRISVVDFGEGQGTRHFLIGGTGYQPDALYHTRVSYGSCSYCDTLQSARDTADKISTYYTLALHMLQSLKKIGDE